MKFRHLGAALAALAALALSAAPAGADNYPVKDGTGANQNFAAKLVSGVLHPWHLLEGLFGGVPTPVTMTNSGALDVTPVALPPGAATAAKQPALGTAGTPSADVLTIQGAASMRALTVDGSAVVQPISAASLPLPAGAGTAANQTSQITQETAINTALGLQGDAACSTDNGSCTVEAVLKRMAQRLTTLNGTLGSPFQAGGSIGNTSFGASGAVGAFLDGWSVTGGAQADAACGSDTGTCTQVALLKREIQRLTTLITATGSPFQAGASIGNTSFGATPVAITPTDKGGTITAGGTAQNAMASNASRKGGWIQNPCSATEDLFISSSTSATTTGASDDADLPPCASFALTTEGGVIQTAISVNAATTGHRWLAKEIQ